MGNGDFEAPVCFCSVLESQPCWDTLLRFGKEKKPVFYIYFRKH